MTAPKKPAPQAEPHEARVAAFVGAIRHHVETAIAAARRGCTLDDLVAGVNEAGDIQVDASTMRELLVELIREGGVELIRDQYHPARRSARR